MNMPIQPYQNAIAGGPTSQPSCQHRRAIMTRACLLTLLLIGGAHGADLGTWGDLYPITEPNMLTTIHDRLNAMQESGELAEQQEAFKERVIKNSLRPAPVTGLQARKRRQHPFCGSHLRGRSGHCRSPGTGVCPQRIR